MAKVSKFEELIAWQKARDLTRLIYKWSSTDSISKDFGLRDQMRRAAVSIMSNIAEGFERSTPKDYHRFLIIAKASCGELRSQLYVALDAGYLNQEQFQYLNNLATETSRIIGGLATSIAKK